MKQHRKVNLDADHAGHLAVVICNYLNHIGNIEDRIISNNATEADLELIEAWEAELT